MIRFSFKDPQQTTFKDLPEGAIFTRPTRGELNFCYIKLPDEVASSKPQKYVSPYLNAYQMNSRYLIYVPEDEPVKRYDADITLYERS